MSSSSSNTISSSNQIIYTSTDIPVSDKGASKYRGAIVALYLSYNIHIFQ